VSRSEQQAVLERFLAAVRTGRIQELMAIMAPDVVLIADGGGFAAAARAPIHGAEKVARVLVLAKRVIVDTTPKWLNGAPAAWFELAGAEPGSAVSLVVENGRVTRIYVMRNPHKLHRIEQTVELAR
jgi:RNA polymerase sigma-70 factor (ECF subfamily)